MVKELKDSEFDEKLKSADKPIIIDFWAPWCGPCKMMGPVFEKVGEEMKDKVEFLKLNVDDNSETPGKLGVRGIPTLILFKNGEEAARHTSYMDENKLKEFVTSNI